MADKSRIEWTDATWNPVTGCDKVSPGCAHCYAFEYAARLKAAGSRRYQKDGQPPTSGPGFGVTLHPDALNQPLLWKRPRRIFVNSMSDLFHEEIPDQFLDQVWTVMSQAKQHVFQVLTKRPERMAEYVRSKYPRHGVWPHLPHIWLGTSVESQYWYDRRIDPLLLTPATVRFLSIEPLLKPVVLGLHRPAAGYPFERREFIRWVIVGGESGHHHRPMEAAWVRSIRDECVEAHVPFFFKQWGGRTPKAGGRELDGRTWDEYPAAA